MIEMLSGFPHDVLAVRAKGEVSADDYRNVLIPAALTLMKDARHLRLYCEIAPEATATAGAMWQDTKLGIGHWGEWGRMAIVSDNEGVQKAVRVFSPFFHHPVRCFTSAEAAQAREWIVAQE